MSDRPTVPVSRSGVTEWGCSDDELVIDDARRIQNGGAIDVNGRCYFCGYDLAGDDPHASDCPWLSMPKIIQVIEAAERLIAEGPPKTDAAKCSYCGAWFKHELHADDCAWWALVRVMVGES